MTFQCLVSEYVLKVILEQKFCRNATGIKHTVIAVFVVVLASFAVVRK